MYGTAALALGGALLVFYLASTIISSRRHAKNAADWGCLPPRRRQHRWPFGLDLVRELVVSDTNQVLPNYLVSVREALGVNTWKQYVIASDLIVTNDPQNLKALLATQFNDFELGEQRRGSFFPLLGNGIFTTDGKAW